MKRVAKVKDKNDLEHVVKANGGRAENWGTGPLGSYRIESWLGPRKQENPLQPAGNLSTIPQ
jgi:hypothetical protein